MPISPLAPMMGGYNPDDRYVPSSNDVLVNGMDWASGGIRRAQELRDLNSGFNRNVIAQMRGIARSTAPTVNEMMQVARGVGGLSRGSSIVIAGEQARQKQTEARQSVQRSFLDHILNNEQMAVQNQGQSLQWNASTYSTMNQREMQQDALDEQYSFRGFANQVLGLGGSLLGRWLTK